MSVVAVLLSRLAHAGFQWSRMPSLLVGVVISTWCCGFGPGLVAIAVCTIGIEFASSFITAGGPTSANLPPSIDRLGGFLVVAALIAAFAATLRHAVRRAHIAERRVKRW